MEQELLADASAFVIHDLLTRDMCTALIEETEEEGYAPAPLSTSGGAVMAPELRSNERVMLDRPDWARYLWARLEGLYLPWDEGHEPIGLNERLRFYRYDVGQHFSPHYDGAYVRPCGTEHSRYTVLVYLNDGFGGGETILHEHDLEVVPVVGMGLFFLHDQLHEGASVVSGRKYVLRTDLMYRDAG